MNDYIREAAGIAFWLAGDDEGEYIQIPDEPFSHYLDEPLPQWLLDALAAQLVRQVDATDTHTITVYGNCSAVIGSGDWIEAKDSDRTMNTIKAIVGSGVLAATEQGESDERS